MNVYLFRIRGFVAIVAEDNQSARLAAEMSKPEAVEVDLVSMREVYGYMPAPAAAQYCEAKAKAT